ncbi:hypothetical protein [Crossiella sp. CA198]|uniref:hypothetical protein n=1 Tax=Crossiella sp. CA198 TaxID=3455607 RepID=UPI003F8D48C9
MITTTLDRLVRKGTPADVPTLTRLLAESFAADPLVEWIFPDPRQRTALLPRMFRVFLDLSLANHGVYTTVDLDSVLLTLPPGATELTGFQQAELDRRFTAALGPEAAKVRAIGGLQDAAHPQDQPHCYFSFACVAPDLQHTGRGRMLAPYVIDRCDRLGLPIYLEASSPGGAAAARLLGFTAHGQDIRLPEGPSLRPMWRAPRTVR